MVARRAGKAELRIICGPTGAGKSAVALELCEMNNAAIISADSRQIYSGFDIGTAKPTLEERARVTHYGIDVARPEERYSAARWANEAAQWIACADKSGNDAVIVGGTGLYIKALVNPLFAAPEVDPLLRAELERELETKSLADLRRWCDELDPARAHLGRTQLLRAIETALLSGSRISDLHAEHKAATSHSRERDQASYLVLDPGSALGARLEKRVDDMLEAGWADEVRELMETVPPGAPAWKASGYAVMREHVEGRLDLSSARQRIIIETRQYAKRQRTWFRHQLPPAAVTFVNPEDSQARAVVREWWERSE
ncbi:MAG TPA: tRNA (adenosine(37)-N6)-dimethylallyltransferase MiaA [Gemmatimonadaceae bacterium]|nr:tRNA (adenosine(37)-N6)-dimethylallyltransferase MiaA [Gemmatimonadaceae bacterium]